MRHPRLVVTNTNGWELTAELSEWTKLQIVWSRLGLDLPDDLKRNIADGDRHWRHLREAIHTGERADKDEETHAAVWRKHAKKARRKLRRRMRGGLDPFDFPDLDASALTVWITEGREPPWAAELDAQIEEDDDLDGDEESGDSVEHQLLVAAIERMADGSWEWDLESGSAEAIVTTADKLSEFREEYNLVLDAAGIGYWVRASERDITGTVNVFDAEYTEQVRKHYEEDPVEAITIAMTQVATGLPNAYAPGPDAWDRLFDLAVPLLDERRQRLLELDPEFDEDAWISREHQVFAFSIGYGLATVADALGIAGTRERQE